MMDADESALPRLTRDLPVESTPLQNPLPERILQFGAGNFLRGFAGWMVQTLNTQGLFQGSIVIVEATGSGHGTALNAQQGLYTTILRGVRDGQLVDERQLIQCVRRVLNPYQDSAWLETATQPEIRFIVSNTTEAGIARDPADALSARPSPSFPGKLAQWLYARYTHFRGDPRRAVVVLPCELIENNGRALQALVLDLADAWSLPEGFSTWLREACLFTNTLVDRIVTGYPADAAALCRELGYEDARMVVAEPYHSWIIEGPQSLEQELPLQAAGLNVLWTDDASPYRECKVRILNGAHTAMAIVGTLAGLQTVGECMTHPAMRAFLQNLLVEEIQPTLQLPEETIESFTNSVLERFQNPFLEHQLASILLNAFSKFQARLLGPLTENLSASGNIPPRLTFVLAALLALYRPDSVHQSKLRDAPKIFETLHAIWSATPDPPTVPLTAQLLADASLWPRNLTRLHPNLVEHVATDLSSLLCENTDRSARLFAHRLFSPS